MAVRKRGTSFQVYWRDPLTGERKSQTVPSLKEARKLDALMKFRKEHERETFTQKEPPKPDGLTVEDAVYAYLKSKQFTPANLRFTISHARPCLAEIGQVQVADLTLAHMRKMVAVFKDAGLKQNGINRKVSIIKAALTWAEVEELAGPNPIARFSCPRGEDEKIVPPTPAEVRRILAVAPPHVHRAVLLSFYLGVRVGASELFGITWENVDMERGVVHVRSAKKNKAVAWRELGISAALAPSLASWGALDGWKGPLVHYEGHAIGHMRRAWASTLAAAGITRSLTPYSLRHAFATYALSAGADVGAVAKVMGHSSTAMIHRNYQHVLDSQRRQVMESLPDLLGTQLGTQQGLGSGEVPLGFCVPTNVKDELKQ